MARIWIFSIACLICTAAGAEEMYRWVDEDGRVHFTDKPRGYADDEPGVERLEIRGPKPLGQGEEVEAIRQRTERMLQEQRERDAERAAEQEEAQRQVQARCRQVERDIRRLSGRVMYRDEDGKPYDVTPQRVAQDKARLEEWHSANCK